MPATIDSLDLNLLSVFEAIMELRRADRAAERLNVTQPAISHALRRLRLALGDPLFVRSSRGLEPTKRAMDIAPGIQEGLAALRHCIEPIAFDPQASDREFRIAASPYCCTFVIPKLAKQLAADAPGIELCVRPLGDGLLDSFGRRQFDLAIAARWERSPSLLSEPLFSDAMIWIAGAHHRLCDLPFSPNEIAVERRVVVAASHLSEPWSDNGLAEILDESRHRAVTVYDSDTAIRIVAATDSVAIVPQRSVRNAERLGFVRRISPELSTAHFSLLWHRAQDRDLGLQWLRAQIRSCV